MLALMRAVLETAHVRATEFRRLHDLHLRLGFYILANAGLTVAIVYDLGWAHIGYSSGVALAFLFLFLIFGLGLIRDFRRLRRGQAVEQQAAHSDSTGDAGSNEE